MSDVTSDEIERHDKINIWLVRIEIFWREGENKSQSDAPWFVNTKTFRISDTVFPAFPSDWQSPECKPGTIISQLLIYRAEKRWSWRLLNLSINRTRPWIHRDADRETDRAPLIGRERIAAREKVQEWPNRLQSTVRSLQAKKRRARSVVNRRRRREQAPGWRVCETR